MNKQRLVLLCGHTVRSSVYVQTLAQAGIVPDAILIYGKRKSDIQSTRKLQNVTVPGLVGVDPCLDLVDCLEELGWTYQECLSESLSDIDLLASLAAQTPDLVVYSGYGGQLVPKQLLQCVPFLHIHSGWLPDYRGSTTLYYQIIEQGVCAASALLLDEFIDTGPILARKQYPLPPPSVDVDYLYDNMIRADLLVIVLTQWQAGLPWSLISHQTDSPPYFIIHPLLKHMALLAIDKKDQSS
ncbi:formyltransferase family protein [Aeromonas hydrophila]|uniref:formyltransferase family protein n=1 Tax=Aeromonas hydrophila TaxID=644 RepID=UPI002362AD85|nr:formyltransferase family protein [Aeromonas hydrophila]